MKKSTIIFFSSLFCCIPKETAAQQQQQSQQRCPLTRERKPWKDLSCSEQNEYLASIRRLKDNGLYDEFVQVHIQNEAASHGTPEFLPWHRWFIYQFESALRQVSADPCITLPYWDWENDAGRESRSHIFDGDAFGSFAGMDVRTGRCGWTTAAGGCLQRDMDPSFPFWSQSRLVGLMTRYSQYADDFPNNPDRNNGFRAAFEAGPHAAPHNMIGGNMVDPTSPNDPIFFLHHANVDRMWAMWQDYHGQSTITTYSAPDHYEGRRLNTPMPFHGNNGVWSFRLGGDDFPTPQEVMSNSGNALRVRYIQDRIIPNHLPNRQWFSSRPRFSTGCNRRRRLRNLAPAEEEKIGDGNHTSTVDVSLAAETKKGSMQQHLLRKRKQLLPKLRGSIDSNVEDVDNPFGDQFETDEADLLLDATSISSWCESLNTFSSTNDHDQWNQLCNDYMEELEQETASTFATKSAEFISDMVANLTSVMALRECEIMGNPPNGREDWMIHMRLSNERIAVMECFHLPDMDED